MLRNWREANRGLWTGAKSCLATLSTVASIVSGFGGIILAVVKG